MDIDAQPDFYSWKQFKDEVLALMPQDAQRLGMDDFLPRLIRQAVIDLQQFVSSYRDRHETIYFLSDFVQEGGCSVGTLPPKSDLQGVWLFKFCDRQRFDVVPWDWARRFELVHQAVSNPLGSDYQVLTAASLSAVELINRMFAAAGRTKHVGLIAVDPQGESFYLYPHMVDGWALSVHWNGRKLDFRDDEMVPFDEDAAFAVASWVKSKIAMEVDRDAMRAEEFMKDYLLKRTNLYIENKEKGRLKS